MYEYIFKGFTCLTSGKYSYQVLEKEEGVVVFTNDFRPDSYLYKLEPLDDFTYGVRSTPHVERLLSSNNSRSLYFNHLVNAKIN